MATLEQLEWDHNGKSVHEVLGFDTVDELKEAAKRKSDDGNLSLLVAAAIMKEVLDNSFMKYMGQLIYPDRASKPSHFCEIVYNLIAEDQSKEEPIIDNNMLLLYTITNQAPEEEIMREVLGALKELLKEAKDA
jgi:hypothetical protein